MNFFFDCIYNYMKGVKKVKQPDINRLVELHGKKVYNFCRRLCRDTYEADDLYQDTFMKAIEKLSSIDEDNNPSAYLCTIAISLYKSKLRKENRRREIAPSVPMEEGLTATGADGPESDVIKQELRRQILAAVDELDDKLRPCVLLHYINDMPLGEIAVALGLPEGTVKSRLFTARNLLKEKLLKGESV